MSAILLIEDNDQNAYLTTFLLEQAGHRIVRARTGLEGLELAQRPEVALILLDIQLPELDGYSVVEQLKANAATAHIPILAVSSYATADEKKKALELGCADYMEKPIGIQKLVARVSTLLAQAQEKA